MAHLYSLARSVVYTQGLSAPAPRVTEPSGQLGEEQAFPYAEHLFSRYGTGLLSHDNTSPNRTLSRC